MTSLRSGTLSVASVVQVCRSALWDEIQAVRKKGSKPLLLTDGTLLSEEAEGEYLYSFTLDAEVILPDDAPGKLYVGEITADATVISITGFTILLLVGQSVGRTVPSARLVTDASYLLEKLRDRLAALPSDPEAARLPTKLLASPMASISRAAAAHQRVGTPGGTVYLSRSLNAFQQQAVAHVATSEISFIWGPPGTGKTTTLGHTVAELLRRGESVLVVAHSNAATDQAALAVGRETRDSLIFAHGSIVRAGISRTPELAKEMQPREIVRRENPRLVQAIEELERERDRLTQQLARAARETQAALQERLVEVRKQLPLQREQLRAAERTLVADARCVLCTLTKAALAEEIFTRTFDAVIVDEASMAYIPADLHVASLARRRVAIFGDFRQLPPITQGETRFISEWLEPDIFEKAGIVTQVDLRRFDDPRLVMLEEQYRMHPRIAALIAKRFYAGRLQTSPAVEAQCEAIVARKPRPEYPVVLVNTGALYPFAQREAVEQHSAARRFGGNSRFNLISAVVAVELALAASTGPDGSGDADAPSISVGIITPYAAQARLIAKLLHDLGVSREQVTCATVHRFQGAERDVIIYDTVESKPFTRAGLLLTGDGSGLERRLLNVALSRAKGKLIFLADVTHLREVLPEGNVYLSILNDMQKREPPMRLVPGSKLASGIAVSAPLPGISFFPTRAAAAAGVIQQQLVEDLRTAEIIAIAGEKPAGVSSSFLLRAMSGTNAVPRQARVYVGSEGLLKVATQEQRWVGPALPCLAMGINRQILWVEGSGYVLRIAQSQTVKLLYDLWDLLPEGVRTLKTTEQQRDLASRGQSPLGRACPKCGSPLWPSDQYGRAVLKCASSICGYSTVFTPALATQFADMMRVSCPECGGQMEGKQGSSGVYLRCMNHSTCKGWKRLKDLI
ncbi:MAG TPA: AAA domain-containing protein [Ktedonobacterales bacterium]|nr:AAA domain-containing protein [Ktedonobacterales bacterium]